MSFHIYKIWQISKRFFLELLIKHKPLFSEECVVVVGVSLQNTSSCFNNFVKDIFLHKNHISNLGIIGQKFVIPSHSAALSPHKTTTYYGWLLATICMSSLLLFCLTVFAWKAICCCFLNSITLLQSVHRSNFLLLLLHNYYTFNLNGSKAYINAS